MNDDNIVLTPAQHQLLHAQIQAHKNDAEHWKTQVAEKQKEIDTLQTELAKVKSP